MDVEPANINQIYAGAHGRMVEIDRDVGGVVDELKRIDPGFGVRFAEAGNPPYWHVYHQEGNTTRLVLSAQAHQNRSGVWEGLDRRIVERIMKIGSSSYDFAGELEKQALAADREKKQRAHNTLAAAAEHLSWAARKDLGATNRIVVPRDLQ